MSFYALEKNESIVIGDELSSLFLHCSLLVVETVDRPGLLVDLVKIITDINIAVESGEFDTEVKKEKLEICSLSVKSS